MHSDRPKFLLTGMAVATALSLTAATALAANVQKEIQTAAQHASFAASSDSLNMAKTHLHHVVNCLVGPDGAVFDPNVLNPCSEMGNGAIQDAPKVGLKHTLQSALDIAKAGLATEKLTVAQRDATQVADLLKTAK